MQRYITVESDHILINRDENIEKLSLVREELPLDTRLPANTHTVENVELSAAELAVLTEVGQVTDDQLANNPLIAQETESIFSDDIFIGVELAVQVDSDDEEENEEDEDEDEVESETD